MSCVNCPTNWKFWYINHAVWKYSKSGVYYTDLFREIELASSPNEMPKDILHDFEGQYYNNYIYIDDSIAIIESCDTKEEKDVFHVLIFPIKHVEGLSIFDYPELLVKIYSAADKLSELAGFKDASYGLSTKMVDNYMPHTHLHVQAHEQLAWDKLRDMLYPQFYKDSQFYKVGLSDVLPLD